MTNMDVTLRTLMVMRQEVADLVNATGRVRAMFDAMAIEHQITPVRETETSRTGNNLKQSIDNAIAWRKEKAEAHPKDERNRHAIDRLTTLLESCGDLTDEQIASYQRAYDDHSYVASSIESSQLRIVGYTYFPDTAGEFVDAFVASVTGHVS